MGRADIPPIPVGVAAYAISTDEQPLRTSGVGSCGVVALHDPERGVSGLVHYMLPTAETTGGPTTPAKYADDGIEALLDAFTDAGGKPAQAWAKIAGGATMIDFESLETPIGELNVEAAERILAEEGIPIRASDVGGDAGRTVTFDPDDGALCIRTADGERRRR